VSKGANGSENGSNLTFFVSFIIVITVAVFFLMLTISDAINSSGRLTLSSRTWLELTFMTWVIGNFLIIYFEISKRIKRGEAEVSVKLLQEFFKWGTSLTFSGLATTIFAMLTSFITTTVNSTDVANSFKDVTNFYVQISLNFLLGGVALVGASFPLLPSLFGQSKDEATSTSQSSRESGGGQQSM